MAKKQYSIQDLRRVFDRAIERKALFKSTSGRDQQVRIKDGDDLVSVDTFFDMILADLNGPKKDVLMQLNFSNDTKTTRGRKRHGLKNLQKIKTNTKLKGEQKDAFKKMLEYVKEEGKTYFTLKGYAGTGKTFTVTKFIESILNVSPKSKIALTAPTNKAVKVLSKHFGLGDDKVHFATIHSLLGLKPIITDVGEEKFEIDKTNQKKIHQMDLLVVDEVSMLNNELFHQLLEEDVKIIFMGDPAQIPPVHETESLPLNEEEYEKYQIDSFTLKTIHRQARNHPIKELAYDLRQNIEQKKSLFHFKDQFSNKKKVKFFDKGDKKDQDAIYKLLQKWFTSKKFDSDADYAKVIAWTNRSVGYYNDLIRRIIYKEDTLPFLMEGEKLIVDRPYFYDEKTLFPTNEEMDVIKVEKDRDEDGYEIYYLSVFAEDPVSKEKFKFDGIPVLHENSWEKFNKDQQELANKAKAFLKEGEKKKAATTWRQFFSKRDSYCWVKHNYAITCHKSQGSTYQHVLLCEYDIIKNPKLIERNRIRYTAVTRPSEELMVII